MPHLFERIDLSNAYHRQCYLLQRHFTQAFGRRNALFYYKAAPHLAALSLRYGWR